MKSDMIIVASNGNGLQEALLPTEKVAEQYHLSPKDALHLRLLVEEMLNMMRSINSEHVGQFWIDATEKEYWLHLKTVTTMSGRKRSQLLSASTSGKNEAHRGIMGKIRAFFEPMPVEDTPEYLAETIVYDADDSLTWSMSAYREWLEKNRDAESGAQEEWDELEKSVVSHVADNIQVSIRGNEVELTIYKLYHLPYLSSYQNPEFSDDKHS